MLYLLIKGLAASSKQQQKSTSRADSRESGVRVTMTRSNSVSSHYDDDNLATFTISYGYSEEKSKNKTPGKWIKSGESITVKGITIARGNVYFGGQLPSLDGYGTEASLIDDSLKIESRPVTYEDDSLSYWPRFISISSGCRGAYLNWLAGNRDDSLAPLGYVFIYFYGLERRIVVDSIQGAVDDPEYQSIFKEILRLNEIYGGSRSFHNYATRLLEIMCLLRPAVVSHPELEKNPKRDSFLLKHKLAKIVDEGKPVSPKLALAWLKFFPEYNLKQPARRCAYEFTQMFHRLYIKKHGEGITVKPNKARLRIEYTPASPSLRGIEIPQEDLPDPSSLKGPTNKLIEIAEECTNALEPYSRYLGKPDTSRTDIAAVLLLPEELEDLSATLGLGKFKKWAEHSISQKSGLVEVSELWQFTKLPIPEKINKKESELIQMMVEKAGFGMAPDSRYHHAKPAPDGKLVLFPEGHGKYFQPSKAFNELGMTLRLGAMVAAIDNQIDQSEVAVLKQLIDHDTNLSPTEKKSLCAYLLWRLNSQANVTGLKTRLEKLGTKEKGAVSKILVGVALADGKIDPEEIKQLEKLYSLLGLDKSLVTGDIHSLSTGFESARRSTTPTVDATQEASKSRGFQLDESVLAIHESQTRDVQTMLGAIFVEEDKEDAAPEEESIPAADDKGIDTNHYKLYESLINQDRWSRNEFDAMCKKLGLMSGGAIETINDWSFDKVDAPVLEEEPDAVYVDQEVVEELEG